MPRTFALLVKAAVPCTIPCIMLASLVFAEGCGSSLAQPFDQMKGQQTTVYILQNYQDSEVQPAAATPGQPTGLNTFIQQGAALVSQWFPGLQLPPGMVPGATPAAPAPAASQYPPFHGYTVLAFKPVTDSGTQSDIVTLFGSSGEFSGTPGACFYPELGFAIANPSGPTADMLVSNPCSQVRAFNITWPYGGNVGLSDDAKSKLDAIARKVFQGP